MTPAAYRVAIWSAIRRLTSAGRCHALLPACGGPNLIIPRFAAASAATSPETPVFVWTLHPLDDPAARQEAPPPVSPSPSHESQPGVTPAGQTDRPSPRNAALESAPTREACFSERSASAHTRGDAVSAPPLQPTLPMETVRRAVEQLARACSARPVCALKRERTRTRKRKGGEGAAHARAGSEPKVGRTVDSLARARRPGLLAGRGGAARARGRP